MLKSCNRRANQVRESINDRLKEMNIRYHANLSIIHMIRLILQLINEIVRSVDTIKEKDRCTKEKLGNKSNLIDKNARVNTKGIAKTLSAFKCYYRVNA